MLKKLTLLLVIYSLTLCVYANYSGGTGDPNDPYLIYNLNDLIEFGQSPGHWDMNFKLMADIDMAEDTYEQFSMIGRDVLSYPRDIKVDSNEKKMYWVDTNYYRIYRANTDGSHMEIVIGENAARPVSIVLDVIGRKIYWGNADKIQRANFNGSDIETITSVGVSKPYGIACDTTRGRIYWTEPYDGQIKRVNVDGTDQNVILAGLTGPRGITVDEENGQVYFTDGDSILKCNPDGGSLQVAASNIRSVKGIALDVAAGKIYWTQYQGVYQANMDGSNPIKLEGTNLQYEDGIGLEFPGPSVYWTSSSSKKINKLGSGVNNYLIKNWFDGVFDGNNHAISNLALGFGKISGVGFFSDINNYGGCENLVLINPVITSPESYGVGSLVGFCSGRLANCSIVGGFVQGDRMVGGLAGRNSGTIEECQVSATVYGSENVGGLIGAIDGSTGDVLRCFSTGYVSGDLWVGGLLGQSGGNIQDCYSSMHVNGNESVGGILGTSGGTVRNCFSQGPVTGNTDVGGLLGENLGAVESSFWDVESSGIAGSSGGKGLTSSQMKTFSIFQNAGWGDIWSMSDDFDTPRLAWEGTGFPSIPPANPISLNGSGSETDPYQIWTAEEFALLSWYPSVLDKHFVLKSDINMDSVKLYPIGDMGSFTGVFDGAGHVISNVAINQPGDDCVGLFGSIGFHRFSQVSSDGEIRNLGLEHVHITGDSYVGGLAGINYGGMIRACYVNGVVTGRTSVGGLVGCNVGSGLFKGPVNDTISESYASVLVTGESNVGGLAGDNYGTINYCYAKGPVVGESNVGGFVGTIFEENFRFLFGIGTFESCFWDMETSGIDVGIGAVPPLAPEPADVTGKTTTEMKTMSTFTEACWDFEEVWFIRQEGETYPQLRWENTAPVADAGVDLTVYAWVDGYAMVQLDGTGSSDADGDVLAYFWYNDANELIAKGAEPEVVLGVGEHIIELIVNDGIEDSEPDSCVVTVVEAIETDARVLPRVFNLKRHSDKIVGWLTLPDGVGADALDPDESMLLLPGDIEPSWQRVLRAGRGWHRRASVVAFYDADLLRDELTANTMQEITLVVKLESGQFVYGTDSIRVIDLMPKKQQKKKFERIQSRSYSKPGR